MLVVTEIFNIVVNVSDAKKSAGYSRALAVTEFVVSGTSVFHLFLGNVNKT